MGERLAARLDHLVDRSKSTVLAALAIVAAAAAGSISSQEGGPRWLFALDLAVAVAATVAYRHHVRVQARTEAFDDGYLHALGDTGFLSDLESNSPAYQAMLTARLEEARSGKAASLKTPEEIREYLASLTDEGD